MTDNIGVFNSSIYPTPAVSGTGTNNTFGIHGESDTGVGVEGVSNSSDGVLGTGFPGVHGLSSVSEGIGVYGETDNGWGVLGQSNGAEAPEKAVGVRALSLQGTGLYASSASNIGVYATSQSGSALVVEGLIQIKGNAVGQTVLKARSTSIVVTTSAATITSIVLLTPLADPHTTLWVTRAAGSFTINAGHAPSSDLPIAYLVIN